MPRDHLRHSADERLPRPRFQVDRPCRRRYGSATIRCSAAVTPRTRTRLITDEGSVDIPLDVEGTDWWLTGLFGAPTTTGTGPYTHVWQSGADTIPSYTLEIGHPKLVTPVFFRHTGVVFESLNFEMGLEGPANGKIAVVSQGRGTIKKAGVQLAGVTAGNLTFSNTLERVRTIRPDGKIDAADPTLASCNGQMTVRFDGTTLVAEASSGDPISIEYGFSTAQGYLPVSYTHLTLPTTPYV